MKMRVNESSRSDAVRKAKLPAFKNLLLFLNGPAPKDATVIQVWKRLRAAADAVAEYNGVLYAAWRKPERLDREAILMEANQLYESVLAGVQASLFGCKIHVIPKSFATDYSRLVSKEVKLSDRQFLEGFADVFIREMPFLRSTPRHGQYALDFLNLLATPEIGMRRISKCKRCERIFLASYLRRQPYCSTKCRNAVNNDAKAPQMKEYMRVWRRRAALVRWPIGPGADWGAELHNWNGNHPKMQYRSVAKFRKEWEKARKGTSERGAGNA